jgi:hypothetical protein
MSSGSHPTANDVRTDRRDPRHERRVAQPHHRAEHPDPRHRAEHSGERHGAETAKRKPAKPATLTTPAKPQERGAYTLGHGGRQVRIGPVAFWTVVGTLVIMAGWSVTTATYFAFQDDVLARMEMQSAYEDRIAEMRAQVDRVTSRHMLEQEQLEQKIEQIVHRQSQLEQRATSLGTVTDPATGSVRTPRGQSPTTKASPISVPAPARAPSDARADAGGFMRASVTPVQRPPLETVMARVEESLDRIEGRQVNTLASLEETYDAKARRMRACSPRSASTPASTSSPRPAARSSPTGSPPMRARSRSRSIASTSRRPRSSDSTARSLRCRCAGRCRARST